MESLFSSAAMISLVTLTLMEVVLGIDNIVFVTIVANRLPAESRKKAINWGLILAMAFRIILLFGITWIIAQTQAVFELDGGSFGSFSPTWRDLILLGGGLFLLYKSVSEMHSKLEGQQAEQTKASENQFGAVLMQIILLNVVFSFDSILTAVGLVDTSKNMEAALIIMIAAVVISMIIMILTANWIGSFIQKHPTVKMLALSFLLLIGFMLTFEGLHSLHHQEIPKGYIYFAMFFSVVVELLNMRVRKVSPPVELHQQIIDKEEN